MVHVGVPSPARSAPDESEQVAGHVSDLHLLRAFGDPVAAMMAVDVLEGLRARVTKAPVDLHRPVGGVAGKAVGAVVTH